MNTKSRSLSTGFLLFVADARNARARRTGKAQSRPTWRMRGFETPEQDEQPARIERRHGGFDTRRQWDRYEGWKEAHQHGPLHLRELAAAPAGEATRTSPRHGTTAGGAEVDGTGGARRTAGIGGPWRSRTGQRDGRSRRSRDVPSGGPIHVRHMSHRHHMPAEQLPGSSSARVMKSSAGHAHPTEALSEPRSERGPGQGKCSSRFER